MVERNMCNAVMRGTVVPPGSKTTSRAKGSRRKLGYPTTGRRLRVRSRVRRSASGRRGAVADDARAWEVGRGHSSCEAGEQGRAICCGVGGAKGRGQGECAPSKHAPDTVPGSACHRRWPHTSIVYLRCVRTRGRSRMRESLMYGSVRGTRGNSRPYRAMVFAAVHESARGTGLLCQDVRDHGENWRVSGLHLHLTGWRAHDIGGPCCSMRFHLDVGSLDERPPFLDFGLLERGECGRRLLLGRRDH